MDYKEKLETFYEAIDELFSGERDYSHMTGDLELCGKTADTVIRQRMEDRRNENVK